MANVGVFSAAIIGDFSTPRESVANLKIYPALKNIPNILILNITEWKASEEFSSEILERFSSKTVIVDDTYSFEYTLNRIQRRTNILGLKVNANDYLSVSAIVGFLSFILVFLGLAFVANKLANIGKKSLIEGIPEAIMYVIFYFIFTQLLFIVSSVLLGMPIGLHTAKLEAKVTAVSLLGFGGGGRPRMLAGIAGFIFGGFLSTKEGLKIDKTGLTSLVVVFFFVIFDPLTSGVIFHEFILLYTTGPYLETAFQTQSYVKIFLGEIGIALGGWASPVFGLSTGTILYCAGIIPFFLFSRLEKSTSTILIFTCAFLTASGGIRVADMNPWSAYASLLPGIVAGLIFTLIFILINLSEKTIRTKIAW
jgi:hypothetical protein